jgi:hypothetical protein
MRRLRCKECRDFDLFDDEEEALAEGWKKSGKGFVCPDCQDGDGNYRDDDDDEDDDEFTGFGFGGGRGFSFGGGSFGGGGGIG